MSFFVGNWKLQFAAQVSPLRAESFSVSYLRTQQNFDSGWKMKQKLPSRVSHSDPEYGAV
jgi:hypothetical protein